MALYKRNYFIWRINMFDFNYRSVIKHAIFMGCILIILFYAIFLSGCAISGSGCGNPVIHNDFDKNDYINEQNAIIVAVPEKKLLQEKHRFRQEKISAKYSRHF